MPDRGDVKRILIPRVIEVKDIRIADRPYFFPSERELMVMLYDSYIDQYEYTLGLFDCDDFALVLHAFIRQEQYKQDWSAPWAFGEVWFLAKSHAINFCITADSGPLLVEPQNDRVEKWRRDAKASYVRC